MKHLAVGLLLLLTSLLCKEVYGKEEKVIEYYNTDSKWQHHNSARSAHPKRPLNGYHVQPPVLPEDQLSNTEIKITTNEIPPEDHFTFIVKSEPLKEFNDLDGNFGYRLVPKSTKVPQLIISQAEITLPSSTVVSQLPVLSLQPRLSPATPQTYPTDVTELPQVTLRVAPPIVTLTQPKIRPAYSTEELPYRLNSNLEAPTVKIIAENTKPEEVIQILVDDSTLQEVVKVSVEEPQEVVKVSVEEPQEVVKVSVEEPQEVVKVSVEEPQEVVKVSVEEPQEVVKVSVEEPQEVVKVSVEEPQEAVKVSVEGPQIVTKILVEEPQVVKVSVEEPQEVVKAPQKVIKVSVEDPQVTKILVEEPQAVVKVSVTEPQVTIPEVVINVPVEDSKLDKVITVSTGEVKTQQDTQLSIEEPQEVVQQSYQPTKPQGVIKILTEKSQPEVVIKASIDDQRQDAIKLLDEDKNSQTVVNTPSDDIKQQEVIQVLVEDTDSQKVVKVSVEESQVTNILVEEPQVAKMLVEEPQVTKILVEEPQEVVKVSVKEPQEVTKILVEEPQAVVKVSVTEPQVTIPEVVINVPVEDSKLHKVITVSTGEVKPQQDTQLSIEEPQEVVQQSYQPTKPQGVIKILTEKSQPEVVIKASIDDQRQDAIKLLDEDKNSQTVVNTPSDDIKQQVIQVLVEDTDSQKVVKVSVEEPQVTKILVEEPQVTKILVEEPQEVVKVSVKEPQEVTKILVEEPQAVVKVSVTEPQVTIPEVVINVPVEDSKLDKVITVSTGEVKPQQDTQLSIEESQEVVQQSYQPTKPQGVIKILTEKSQPEVIIEASVDDQRQDAIKLLDEDKNSQTVVNTPSDDIKQQVIQVLVEDTDSQKVVKITVDDSTKPQAVNDPPAYISYPSPLPAPRPANQVIETISPPSLLPKLDLYDRYPVIASEDEQTYPQIDSSYTQLKPQSRSDTLPYELLEPEAPTYYHRETWNESDKVGIPGIPNVDYPTLNELPNTIFSCKDTPYPGYYADVNTGCQVFHICQKDGRHDRFLCPIGSIFHQKYFICDWWYNVNCSASPEYYNLNSEIGKTILIGEPEESVYSVGLSAKRPYETNEYKPPYLLGR